MTSSAERFDASINERLHQLRAAGTYKHEIIMEGPQSSTVTTVAGPMRNFCANNYLGLASHPAVVEGARRGLQERGVGLASVRFICGTQDEHRALEQDVAGLLGYDDAILFGSCFDANTGLFAGIATEHDVIISDELNHASIIDGIRLSRARRSVYRHGDVADLRHRLGQARDEAHQLFVVTDGVFSMEGHLAPLPQILDVAEEFGAVVVVDDSHGVGVVGAKGFGTVDLYGAQPRVAIQTGTFGKALGGASGGYVVGSRTVVDLLRQTARPYLFSNALAPAVVGSARAAIDVLTHSPELVRRLHENVVWFREAIASAGFKVLSGDHAIVAVMVGEEERAAQLATRIRQAGVLVVAFSYPVVPRGEARIRVQISADHSRADLEAAVGAFRAANEEFSIV
ncbi:glycine C-acetyltransferase [Nocardioides bigeumensis]|uniref:8-amino-7-oxononanoate synthase n=1 Tax=Nocardioides bigeumensis TaxID=433657 RepID=A0ABP5JAX8_9ACTN